jgi:hypothetical protein
LNNEKQFKTYQHFVDAFNEKFHQNRSLVAFRMHCYYSLSLQIISKKPKVNRSIKKRYAWTDEEIQLLKKLYDFDDVHKMYDIFNKCYHSRSYYAFTTKMYQLFPHKLYHREFTQEEIQWVKDNYQEYKSIEMLYYEFNDRFSYCSERNMELLYRKLLKLHLIKKCKYEYHYGH